jgi:hypothetical protein
MLIFWYFIFLIFFALHIYFPVYIPLPNTKKMFGGNGNELNSVILVAILVLICWLIFYKAKDIGLERFAANNQYGERSYRDWPYQPLGTAARQAQLSRGYNEPINPALPDPYLSGILDMSAQENSWVTADWSATK